MSRARYDWRRERARMIYRRNLRGKRFGVLAWLGYTIERDANRLGRMAGTLTRATVLGLAEAINRHNAAMSAGGAGGAA